MSLKNMKMKTKFMVGFGSILVLLCVLATWSVVGIGGIVSNAEEVIDGNKLRGDFIQRIVDHLKWAEKVNKYLSDPNEKELNVQLDPHKCAFGKWYYGEGRKDAEQLVPAIAELMRQIEDPHTRLHESAKTIKETNAKVDMELFSYFQSIKAAHLYWMNKLLKPLADPTLGKAKVQEDWTACALGKWLYSNEIKNIMAGDPELAAMLKPIYEPHQRLHASATAINKRLAVGDHAGALSIYERNTVPAAEETIGILDGLITACIKKIEQHDKAMDVFVNETTPQLEKVQEILNQTRATVAENIMTDEAMLDAASMTRTMVMSVSGLAIVVGFILAYILCNSICGPLLETVRLTMGMAEGDFTQRLDEDRKDELGDLAKAVNVASDSLERRTMVAKAISEGDLTNDIYIASEKDELGKALDQMIRSLREIITAIIDAAGNVESGSVQVSQSSISLSQGATQQAASSEEINSTMTEISSQTRTNSENASEANDLAASAQKSADKGSHEMEQMVEAMTAIDSSSQAISKIIKVIDEIAFQTNLLALNAAVEAARAGRHGKGFAVVAEEVRSLAGRSAKAAQETTQLIEGSLATVKDGGEIASATAESFKVIVDSIGSMAELVQEIHTSSAGQSEAIRLINDAMDQMEEVTQSSSANAEETAAASEELTSQAQQLRQMISHFKVDSSQSTIKATTRAPLALDQGADVKKY